MNRRPIGISVIALLYLAGSAGYTILLLAWLFARGSVVSFIEGVNPSASLGPALLLNIPGSVTTYFAAMAGFCCWTGVALWKLHRWAWFATCAFVVFSFVLDASLFASMFRHLPIALAALGTLRLAFLVWLLVYLSKTRARRAFGLAKAGAARTLG